LPKGFGFFLKNEGNGFIVVPQLAILEGRQCFPKGLSPTTTSVVTDLTIIAIGKNLSARGVYLN
jgi:hypothetical protein